MLGYYNLSLQGESHKKSGTVCQDYSCIVELSCGWIVAAIADGVGSAKYSDIGSSLAVNALIDCVSNSSLLKWEANDLSEVMRKAFETALERIIKRAAEDGNLLSDYDTTLTAAIYNSDQLMYAHVGDGGIVILSENGDLSMLTSPQKGDVFNSVNPLRSEVSWEFGSSEKGICAFAMFTDGIYDVVCPWILSQQEQKIYVNYIRPFMDRNLMNADTMEDFAQIKTEVEAFLNSESNANITDDKTIAVVVNTDIMPAVKADRYYEEPDWEQLRRENRENLYSSYEDCGGGSKYDTI